MKYKLTIWHHLKDEVSANSMCEELRSKEFTNIKIVWVRSHFGLKDNFDFRWFYIDVEIPNPSIMTTEKICQYFFENWSDAISYIKLESQYPSSWKERFEKAENIKKSSKYVAGKIEKSFCKPLPFSEHMIWIANDNYTFEGGILINEKFVDERYHDIESKLLKLGFNQISYHNVQKNCYKVDFNANIIRGTTLISNGWFCDELRNWRLPNNNARMVYPNDHQLHRGANWYYNETEWQIIKIKQDTFFDCSGDDLSLNPAFW